jgi:hypothetical protein
MLFKEIMSVYSERTVSTKRVDLLKSLLGLQRRVVTLKLIYASEVRTASINRVITALMVGNKGRYSMNG